MRDPIFGVECKEPVSFPYETLFFQLIEPGFESKSYSLQQMLIDNPNEYIYKSIKSYIEQYAKINSPQRFCFIADYTCFIKPDRKYILVGNILK